MILRNNATISSVTNKVIPPIPDQEQEEFSGKQLLHPYFITKEFILGFRYMLGVMILFWTASRICDSVRMGLPVPPDIFVLNTHFLRTPLTPIVSIAERGCLVVFGEEIYSSGPLWYVCLVGPFVEEITFRGIGHLLFQSTFKLGMIFFASLCRHHLFLGYTMLAGLVLITAAYATALLTSLWGSQPILTCTTALIHSIAQLVICISPALALLDIMRKPKISDPDDDTNSKNASYFTRLVLGMATGRAFLTTADAFDACLTRSMQLHARLAASLDFGLCHVTADCVPLPEALMDFQKAFGSFASSFLVESRLAVKRRNLWAPIGAHVAWNFVTCCVSYQSFVIIFMLSKVRFSNLGRRVTAEQNDTTSK